MITLTISLRKTLLIGCCLLIIALAYSFWHYEIAPKPELSSVTTWREITPGATDYGDVFQTLGEPKRIDNRGPYTALRYQNKKEWGWEESEIWVEKSTGRVIGIFLAWSYEDAGDIPTFESAVLKYGRPDAVTWAVSKYGRYLIWSRHGIAMEFYAGITSNDWDEITPGEIFIFRPMGIRAFFRENWVFPEYGAGFSLTNRYSESPVPDSFPKDPYDWDHILTPSTTEIP